jgi:hypothetical protein
VQEFIKRKGVTPCPSFGTPEFREMNIEREKQRNEENSRKVSRWMNAKAARLKKAVRL